MSYTKLINQLWRRTTVHEVSGVRRDREKHAQVAGHRMLLNINGTLRTVVALGTSILSDNYACTIIRKRQTVYFQGELPRLGYTGCHIDSVLAQLIKSIRVTGCGITTWEERAWECHTLENLFWREECPHIVRRSEQAHFSRTDMQSHSSARSGYAPQHLQFGTPAEIQKLP